MSEKVSVIFSQYTHAIISGIPKFIFQQENIKAIEQHKKFTKTIKSLVRNVIYINPMKINFPAYQLESCIIAYHGTAILTEAINLYSPELISILRHKLGLRIVECYTKSIRLNGSDVLFTGNEFFIGIGKYTNLEGAFVVASSFPDFPCIPIDIPSESINNLKYFVTMAGPGFMCVNESKIADRIIIQIMAITVYPYRFIRVPDDDASNVLYCNSTLIHRSLSECYHSGPTINKYFKMVRNDGEYVPEKIIPMGFNEIGQMSCGFSAFCLMIRHPKYIRDV